VITSSTTRFADFAPVVSQNNSIPHAVIYPCGMESADFFVPKIERIAKFESAYIENASQNRELRYLGFNQHGSAFIDILCSCVIKHKHTMSLSFYDFEDSFKELVGKTILQSHIFFEHYYGITLLEQFEEFLFGTKLFQRSNLTVHIL